MKLKAALIISVLLLLIITIADKMQKFANVSRPLRRRKCDTGGCGHFGASRNPNRLHRGLDFLIEPGEAVFAPISGKIRLAQPYKDDARFLGVEITGSVYRVKVFYFLPVWQNGSEVKKGDILGYAQDLGIKYGAIVPNHLHVEVRRYGILVDPTKYFAPDTLPVLV